MDGKLWRENGKKKLFEVFLVGWRGRKINGRPSVFSLGPPKRFFPKLERKLKKENETT